MKRYLYTEHEDGSVNKVPLSETEYASITWDWQIELNRLQDNLFNMIAIKNSMDTLNDLSLAGKHVTNWWDREVKIAEKAYEDYMAMIVKGVK